MSAGPIVYIVSGDLLGGKEVQIELQLCELRRSGFDCRAVLFCHGLVEERFRARGIPCEVVEETGGWRAMRRSLAALLFDLAPGIVTTHGYKETFLTAAAMRQSAVPFVVVFHGKCEPFPGLRGFKMRLYERLMVLIGRRFAGAIVCVSDALRISLGLAHTARASVVRNIVAPPAADERTDLDLARPAVVMVGRFVRVKRFDRAIEALRLLRDRDSKHTPSLYLVGSGPDEESLRSQVRLNGLEAHVHFPGFRDDAAAIIGSADFFLLSSESEGIPTVLLEALVRGVPAVATAVGGIPEIMEDLPEYPAELVEEGSPAAIAGAVARMLADRKGRDTSAAAKAAEQFSVERGAARLLSVFRECGYGG